MKNHTDVYNKIFFLAILLIFIALSAGAQVESPVQSNARPFDLDIVDTVNLAESDAQSTEFQNDVLPTFNSFINQNLGEKVALPGETVDSLALDPSKLQFVTENDVRVYFVGEGAGYHNTLGFNTNNNSILTNDSLLIFPDASSRNSYLDSNNNNANRTKKYPLLPGDFVDLGEISAGTQLDFFLIANGANGGNNVYTTQGEASNPDGIVHTVAYAIEDSPYLLIGFEDLWGGGDNDYNDLLFAAEIGEQNVEYLSGSEPMTMLTLSLLLVISLIVFKRKQPIFQ